MGPKTPSRLFKKRALPYGSLHYKIIKNLITLIALITSHRLQTLSKITIDNIILQEDRIEIKIPDTIKTSKPDKNQPLLIIPKFTDNPKWCCYSLLVEYMKRISRGK